MSNLGRLLDAWSKWAHLDEAKKPGDWLIVALLIGAVGLAVLLAVLEI